MNIDKDECIRCDNALTVDLEEWFHICGAEVGASGPPEWRVRQNLDRLLAELDAHGVKATFFVLGALARELPELVPAIAGAGHEIASHGFSHTLVTALGPAAFRDEVCRTGETLARQSGRCPIGFRAPQWSLSRQRTPWAFEILVEEGFRYDASCTPLPFIGERSGSRSPFRMDIKGKSLWEVPPLVTPSLLGNLPTGGGWGFRFFPLALIERTMRICNGQGVPAVLFLHPRELDPAGPRLRLSLFREFVAYGPRTDIMERLRPLLGRFRFTTLGNLVEQWDSA
ncbi:MAG: DUF3473 domain-containing protein [Geobacter sp.]|nr:DUF3473 domain-containing protein [Geobacter sp.]